MWGGNRFHSVSADELQASGKLEVGQPAWAGRVDATNRGMWVSRRGSDLLAAARRPTPSGKLNDLGDLNPTCYRRRERPASSDVSYLVPLGTRRAQACPAEKGNGAARSGSRGAELEPNRCDWPAGSGIRD
jgi:hypothetical protein